MEPEQTEGTAKYVVGIIIIGMVVMGVSLASKKQTVKQNAETASIPVETPASPQTSINEIATTTDQTATVNATQTVEVDYTDNGFAPAEVSVKIGDTVKFTNKSSENMWVGSNDHPTHTLYDGTKLREHCPDTTDAAFDQCETGREYSFTFGKTGSWKYHNHRHAEMGGAVIVK